MSPEIDPPDIPEILSSWAKDSEELGAAKEAKLLRKLRRQWKMLGRKIVWQSVDAAEKRISLIRPPSEDLEESVTPAQSATPSTKSNTKSDSKDT